MKAARRYNCRGTKVAYPGYGKSRYANTSAPMKCPTCHGHGYLIRQLDLFRTDLTEPVYPNRHARQHYETTYTT